MAVRWNMWDRSIPITPFRYGLAVTLSVVALLLSVGLSPWIQESPFSLFLAAVAVSAWYGGLGPGMVTTILGGLICATFFLPPFASPTVATITSAVRLVIFLLVAILISSLSATLREARHRAEAGRQRLQFLAAASQRLAASLDYDRTLAAVARLVVPRLADYCLVDVVEEDGAIRRVTVAHAYPEHEHLVSELCRYAPTALSTSAIAEVLRSGKPHLLREITDSTQAASTDDPHEHAVVRRLGPRSMLILPLNSRERVLGAISLVTSTSRPLYVESDLDLAGELASRVALAVDNGRLYAAARRAVSARDEFLASASHELRTPLSHIKGFVSTLRQTDVEWEEEIRQELLADAERETDRLSGLIRDVLDMTRLQSGGADEGERTEVQAADLVAGGLDRVRGLLGDRQVSVEVPPGLPTIMGDGAQLERVIANLVENAVKFSPSGSPITVSCVAVDGSVDVRVDDAGPGIPDEQLELIFEKFYRIRSQSTPIPGTGLGLAICRRIVDAHGGRIWAENRMRGARFTVRLPVEMYTKGTVL
ncbi:MAG: ATP-binding protein [Chloroflexota bacterium]